MRKFLEDNEDMEGLEFQKYCYNMIKRWYPEDSYQVDYEHSTTSKRTGKLMKLDIYISKKEPKKQRRDRYVIECKFYRTRAVKRGAGEQVERYRRAIKGKAAMVFYGASNELDLDLISYAEQEGIHLIGVYTQDRNLLTRILNYFTVKMKLKQIME